MKDKPEISVIIPALNEEENIAWVLRNLPSLVEEVIVVDGHSTDDTVRVAKRLGAKVIYDNRKGKGEAIREGTEEAKGEIIVFMDADGSQDPAEIELLVRGIKLGYDICMGSRFIEGGRTEDMLWYRVMGNRILVTLINLIWQMDYSDLCYGYRAFRKESIEKLNLKSNGFDIESEISIKAAKKDLRVIEIPSFEKAHLSGEGKLKTFQDGYIILRRVFIELFKN